MASFWLVLAGLLMLVGLIGTLVPGLPGVPFIWVVQLAYGWYEGFTRVDPEFLAYNFVLAAAAMALAYLAGAWGARRFGASRAAAWGAVLGALAGVVVLGPLGLLVGPFAGAALIEALQGRPLAVAVRSGIGSVLGMLGGSLINLAIALLMIIWFFVRVLGGG